MLEREPSKRPPAIAHSDFVYRTPAPPVFVGADGVFLTDSAGRRFLDSEAANGAAILGYDASIFAEAQAQLAKLPALPSFCESEIRLSLAAQIVDMVEAATGLRGRVAFETGGAQAIELALKIARANSRGSRVVTFEGAYHGRSYLTSALSASQRYRDVSGSSHLEVSRLPLPDCSRCRFSQVPETCAAECARFVEFSFSEDAAGLVSGKESGDLCALLFEPILNVAGMVMPDSRYIQAAVRAVRQHGGLVIADEVFTGLFRSGKLFGFLHHDVKPDIIVFSKGLTNGMVPMSCVWAREALFSDERFGPGSHSATYINGPLGCAVAQVVLRRLLSLRLETAIGGLERALTTLLARVSAKSDLVSGFSVHGATARLGLRSPQAAAVRAAALSAGGDAGVAGVHGVLLASTGMAPDTINLHPPFVTSSSEMEVLEELLTRTFTQVEAALRG